MNLATGSLVLFGFVVLIIGIISKILGLSLLQPFIASFATYLVVANTCFLMALVIDRFQSK